MDHAGQLARRSASVWAEADDLRCENAKSRHPSAGIGKLQFSISTTRFSMTYVDRDITFAS